MMHMHQKHHFTMIMDALYLALCLSTIYEQHMHGTVAAFSISFVLADLMLAC